MKDPKERFSATAGIYDRARPSYPAALFDWTVETAALRPSARVVDVGCGTGISTRLWAGRGFEVVGVDPNEDMLAAARAAAPGARFEHGEASALPFPNSWGDLAAAAQAFHWFDLEATLAEWKRVLKPGGWCAAWWNSRETGDAGAMDAYEALLQRFSVEYARVARPEGSIAGLKASAAARDLREAVFPNAQRLDREGFLRRVRSSSYVAHGVADAAAFERELGALFDRHAEGGVFEFRYRAVGICWRLA